MSEIDLFLEQLRVEKRYSAHTLEHYRRDLEQFINWLNKDRSSTVTLLEAVTHDLQSYSAFLNKQGRKPSTIQRKLSSLRSFFSWAIEHYQLKTNPATRVRTPKASRKLPHVLDIETLDYIMSLPSDSALDRRDCAILELFYSSGLRLSELVDIDLNDYSEEEALIRVKGKGNKSRILPVGGKAVSAIRQWLDKRSLLLKGDCDALFISQRGKRLGQRAVQLRLVYWQQQAGLPQNLHPHKLRHSFASHMLESSGDLRAVQELLGHANLATTQIYTHLDYQHLAKVYDKAHPRSKKK